VVNIGSHDADDSDAARVETPEVGWHAYNDARRATVEGLATVEGSCWPYWVLLLGTWDATVLFRQPSRCA
jgi:hypothetical protein